MRKYLISAVLVFPLFFFAVPSAFAQTAQSSSGTSALTRVLYVGVSGADVTVLQRVLRDTGYLTSQPTGYFGPLTQAALMNFQRVNGLEPVGSTGPLTRQLINTLLSPAATASKGTSAATTSTKSSKNTSSRIALTFTSAASSIKAGKSTSLSWTAKNADTCTASNGWSGELSLKGKFSVSPASSTSYTLTCNKGGESVSKTVAVKISTAVKRSGGGGGGGSSGGSSGGGSGGIGFTGGGSTPVPTTTVFKQLTLGAGGYVTGIDIHTDGTKVVRTNTAGAWLWNNSSDRWTQLITKNSLPSGDPFAQSTNYAGGAYEIVIAPSNSNVFWLAFNGYIYKSSNKGSTWTRTALPQKELYPNSEVRILGTRLAVDPQDPNRVLLGTLTQGLFMTTDGGANWSSVGSVLNATTQAGVVVAFDPASPVVNGATQGMYAFSNGRGLYHSIDGGITWALVAGAPTSAEHMVVDQVGKVWIATGNAIQRYSGGVWTQMNTPGAGSWHWHAVAVDPADSNHIVAQMGSGALSISSDGGSTWSSLDGGPASLRTSTDIPWLAWTNESSMSSGDIMFDPTSSNKLYFSEGIGVWWARPTAPSSGNTWTTWTSQSAGIENLAVNMAIKPPGGALITANWDRPLFRMTESMITQGTYPSTHGPDAVNPIVHAWAADWSAQNPNYLVAIMDVGFGSSPRGVMISTDGGSTWNQAPNTPTGFGSSGIAVGAPGNIVLIRSNNGQAYVTQNGGSTWSLISLPGITTSGAESGFGFAYYLKRFVVTADRVNTGTFYMYNYLPGGGVYRSVDNGVTWTKMHGRLGIFESYNAKMRVMPGEAGHVFFAGADQSDVGLMHSRDGGATWTTFPGLTYVWGYAFGKAAPGQTQPSIYIGGLVDGTPGIYRSDNEGATWTFLGSYPMSAADTSFNYLEADPDVYGRFYVGNGGSGWFYGTLQ